MPYYIHRADEQPIAFAGLWERWHRDDRVIESFTILTTSPNQLMRSIHDRMPVVIAPKNYALWLDRRSDPNVLLPLLEAQDDSALVATPVGDLVNNPRNDVPNCIEPLAAEPPGHTLF